MKSDISTSKAFPASALEPDPFPVLKRTFMNTAGHRSRSPSRHGHKQKTSDAFPESDHKQYRASDGRTAQADGDGTDWQKVCRPAPPATCFISQLQTLGATAEPSKINKPTRKQTQLPFFSSVVGPQRTEN